MTINSYFYDSTDTDPRVYTGNDFAKAFGVIMQTGVIQKTDGTGGLTLDIGGTNYTTIYAGKAVVEGRFVEVTGTETLTVPAGTYSGSIVLRVDFTDARKASIVVRTDQTPQQDTAAYELVLYFCTVGNGVITGITDKRTQGGAVAKTAANVVVWEGDPNGISAIVGKYNSTGKPVRLFLTSAQPAASSLEHRAWIQIDNF